MSTWLVLNINASPTTISPNGNSIITADLTHDQNGTYYDPTLGHVPDGIPVSFTCTFGTLNSTSTTTLNGNGASIYTAGIIAGSGSVKVIVDNQIVNNQININNPEADSALSQIGNYSGSSVTFIVTATNNGPDNATYINIKDLIPVGLTGATVSPSVGSYNSTTGIWTINSLLEGTSATLNISGITTPLNTINNTATKINQTEYDPNTPETTTLGVYVPSVDMYVQDYPWYYDTVNGYENTYSISYIGHEFILDVENWGTNDATGVVVTYKIGNGLQYLTSCTQGVGTTSYNSHNKHHNMEHRKHAHQRNGLHDNNNTSHNNRKPNTRTNHHSNTNTRRPIRHTKQLQNTKLQYNRTTQRKRTSKPNTNNKHQGNNKQ